MALAPNMRLLGNLCKNACKVSSARFSVSSPAAGNVSVVTDDKGIAIVSMDKGPVNSLNTELIQELTSAIATTSNNAKGIVLTSSLPSVFCAGLEITEMYQPEQAKLEVFWGSLQDLWIELYSCKVPTGAAIIGHSPAGGCLLAMCCDYRTMVGPKFTIGLNETQLGIVAPFWFKDTMVNTIGQRQTELALMLGTLFNPQQALSIGMVDQVVDNREECLAATYKIVSQLSKIPSEARHVSKMLMRQPTLDSLTSNKQKDIEYFAKFIQQPIIQKPMGMYLEALKAKSKKK